MHSVIILAGGFGKRMAESYPNTPKVCIMLKHKPMIVHLLQSVLKTQPSNIYIVVGKSGKIIQETIENYITDKEEMSIIKYVIQGAALGTGHAVQVCVTELYKVQNQEILILCGDVPLTSSYTLNDILKKKNNIIVTTEKYNPAGMGRVIMNDKKIIKITEDRDCTEEEKKIKKVNCGIYKINGRSLFSNLYKLENNNAASEYYLTDIVEILHKNEQYMNEYLMPCEKMYEVLGANTIDQLHELEHYM